MELIDVLAKIGFDWRLALANIVNFLIVFWLLKKFVWAPMRLRIEDRQKKIDKGLDDAEKAELAISQARDASELLLDEAKKARHSLLEEARSNADAMLGKAVSESQEQAERITLQAQRQAAEMEKAAVSRVHEQSVDLVVSAARAVLEDQIDEKRGEEIIHSMLRRA